MHSQFSRHLAPIPQNTITPVGGLLLGAVAVAGCAGLALHPLFSVSGIAVVAALSVFSERQRSRTLTPLALQRQAEDIGTFARSFHRHGEYDLDLWAIRAVWNAFVPFTAVDRMSIPLRGTDRFWEDLQIDPDEVDDLLPELVVQCERVPGNWTANPFYNKVATISDLVYFVSAQPLRRATVDAPAP